MLRYIKNQEHINPSSAQDLCASPIKEKRLARFSSLDLLTKSEQCGTCNERGARSSPRNERREAANEVLAENIPLFGNTFETRLSTQ